MRRIKEIFDPGNIFNPGKKFESRWIAAPATDTAWWRDSSREVITPKG
jgi:hypothetical protein